MPFYEVTLTATVSQKIPVMAEDYAAAVEKAKARFTVSLAELDPEVEMFIALDDEEVVKLRASGAEI